MAGAFLLAALANAQPLPAPRKVDDSQDELALERAKLQKQLGDLLKRLEQNPPLPGYGSPPSLPKPGSGKKIETIDKSVDPLRVGMNLFRDNDHDGALRAFRFIDPATLTREDRAFSQYMQACCLRRLNKRGDAVTLFREVADLKEDEFISEMAIWQLAMIRSSQELEAQIEQFRSRAKTR